MRVLKGLALVLLWIAAMAVFQCSLAIAWAALWVLTDRRYATDWLHHARKAV